MYCQSGEGADDTAVIDVNCTCNRLWAAQPHLDAGTGADERFKAATVPRLHRRSVKTTLNTPHGCFSQAWGLTPPPLQPRLPPIDGVSFTQRRRLRLSLYIIYIYLISYIKTHVLAHLNEEQKQILHASFIGLLFRFDASQGTKKSFDVGIKSL